MLKKIQIKQLILFIIPLIPLLSIYRFIIEGLSFADVLMMGSILYLLLYQNINKKDWIITALLLFYLLISLIVSYSIVGYFYLGNIIFRIGKTFIYIVFALSISNLSKFKKILYHSFSLVGNFMYMGLAAQYIWYGLFKKYLLLKIPFLNYVNNETNIIDFVAIRTNEFRPSSFFLEPAHFAVFAIFHLLIILFSRNIIKENKKIFYGIAVSIFAFFSTSSTAIILIPIIWVYYLLFINRCNVNITKKVLYLLFLVIIFSVLLKFQIISDSLYRVLDINSIAVTGRLFVGNSIINNLSINEIVFGVGYGNVNSLTYMNSYNILIYYNGIIGVILFSIFIFILFFKSNKENKLLLLLFVLLMAISPTIISINIVLFIIIYKYAKKSRRRIRFNI